MCRPKKPLYGVSDERGIAVVTVVLVMLMLAVMGVAAITVSGLENQLAGLQRTSESAAIAAESCVGTGANIIQQTIEAGSLPTAFKSDQTPAGPVPAAIATTLNSEIMGQSDNNSDSVTDTTPNMSMTVGAFTVKGDIDRLYAKAVSGGAQVFAGAYEGYGQGAGAGGIEIHYKISCLANNTATGTNSNTTAVYACLTTGESCQRKL